MTDKLTAAMVANTLGINRRRDGDLREMVRALEMPWLNMPDDDKWCTAAQWALDHWAEYQAECNRRRDRPHIRCQLIQCHALKRGIV